MKRSKETKRHGVLPHTRHTYGVAQCAGKQKAGHLSIKKDK